MLPSPPAIAVLVRHLGIAFEISMFDSELPAFWGPILVLLTLWPGAIIAGVLASWGIAALIAKRSKLDSDIQFVFWAIFLAEVILTHIAWIAVAFRFDSGWK